jgi:hypothetical protein
MLAVSLMGISQQKTLFINEFMASNVTTLRNPLFSEYSDWLELYNAGTSEVNIKGYYLSDNPEEPRKWEIPVDNLISSGGYMLFWADDVDGGTHTNFRLSRSGEFLGLYDPDGNVVDSITFGYQEDDISFGRLLTDLQQWVFFDEPTPGTANPEVYIAGRSADTEFSVPGGFYVNGQNVQLSVPDPSAEIHYTLDGTVPGELDPVYTGPLRIDSTTALRARTISAGKLPGNTITQTYFIGETVNLPIVSLVTDPANLFDEKTGIYVTGTNGVPGYCTSTPMNVNQDWERPVNIEIYDVDGTVEINQQAGIKIYGGCSRTRYPQKSFALYARGIYGKGSFDYQLFRDKPIYSFESFILRSSADDVVYTMMKDGMGQTILDGMDIDRQAYRPAVVFINGQYWGIHNMREKISEHYVAGNYPVDPEEVNLLERNPENSYNVIAGSADHYNNLLRYIMATDMSGESVYAYISRHLDVNNYIDYQIAEIFLSANDWPGNNIKFWRADSGPYDRWRWIIFDLDNCFFYIDRNTLELATDPDCNCNWPNPPWSTRLFRRLLENETFRNEFIQRYAWHMNTTFSPERVFPIIDSLKANIAAEIPRHIERWGGQLVPNPEPWIRPTFNSIEEWAGHIEYMKYFITERKVPASLHVCQYFNLPGMVRLTIRNDQPEAGRLKLNRQLIEGSFHSGDYFMDIPLAIRAIPAIGYAFSHWEISSPGKGTRRAKDPVLELIPGEDVNLVAFFVVTDEPDPVVVINEINYHSGEEQVPGDWVELYNRKNEIIDLSGWTFQDENDDHIFTFPVGLEIGPNGYLVVCEDVDAFRYVFPGVSNQVGNTGFGFSNGGEVLRLYRPGHILVDSVRYDDELPWPEEADGNGPTLELLDPSLNNDLPESWKASAGLGTPGRQNFSNTIETHTLSQNYPNPCSGITRIPFSIVTPGFVEIKVYDVFGRHIITLINSDKGVAKYEADFDVSELSEGVYLYSLLVDGRFIKFLKMIKQ